MNPVASVLIVKCINGTIPIVNIISSVGSVVNIIVYNTTVMIDNGRVIAMAQILGDTANSIIILLTAIMNMDISTPPRGPHIVVGPES